jgi:DNA-binding LacI/PurR family transcriptional regulator
MYKTVSVACHFLYRIDMGRATIEILSRRLNLSKSTVSRVMNNYPNSGISESTRKRVLEACRDAGYTPNAVARALATKSNSGIGLLCDSLTDYCVMQVVRRAVEIAAQYGRHVVISTEPDTIPWINLLHEGRVGWIIAIGDYMTTRSDDFKEPELLDRIVSVCEGPYKEILPIKYKFTWDMNRAGIMAMDHLAELGHREVAVLAGPFPDQSYAPPRSLSAYRRAGELGLTAHWIVNMDENLEDIPASGQAMTRQILERYPNVTAIVCRQDLHAVGVYRELHRVGKHIPEDIAVIGHFNLQPVLYLDPPLTSIQTPLLRATESAMYFVISHEEKCETKVADFTEFHELIVRDSTVKGKRCNA